MSRSKYNRGKIMVETSGYTSDGWNVMKYYNTEVARYRDTKYLDPKDPRGGVMVQLDTGGYSSMTTKKRMNQFAVMFDLPFVVYQHKGEWFVVYQHKGEWFVDIRDKDYNTLARYEFKDNKCSFTITK